MMVPVTDFIDQDVAGHEIRTRSVDLASFTAGFLAQLTLTPEFQRTEVVIREKVRHLVCRLGDFETVYREFLSVVEVLTCGNIGWDNEEYFRDWEKKTLLKISQGSFGVGTVRDRIVEKKIMERTRMTCTISRMSLWKKKMNRTMTITLYKIVRLKNKRSRRKLELRGIKQLLQRK